MVVKVLMPALSPTMTEGTLARWLKEEGQEVKPGEVIAEIETDKATMEVEAIDAGKLGEIIVPAGTTGVPVQQLIGVILEEGEEEEAIAQLLLSQLVVEPSSTASVLSSDSKLSEPSNSDLSADSSSRNELGTIESTIEQDPSSAPKGRVIASPLAKRIAKDKKIDLFQISGTGPKGRIVRADVMAFIENNQKLASSTLSGSANQEKLTSVLTSTSTIANLDEAELVPISSMRKVIAQRLLESKQTIPHFYLSISCEVSGLLSLRQEINSKLSTTGSSEKVSVNDLMVKAAALALRDCPSVNSSWTAGAIKQYKNVDVAVAVALPDGLITPIVRNADQKSLLQISREIKELASKAKEYKLKPEEYQGGGFSIWNLGMYGIDKFFAIINPPQAVIMAIGSVIEQPVIKDGAVVPGQVITVTLSCDHRVVDGAKAAEYLAKFKQYLASSVLLLL